ncbi:MAG: NAD-dependent epimerase/dehydratase [uncultured Solirubrobacteraceae bacterium]|uniref:NAD-dependent epimerase/dehydratase n=1 Tax=uncultured Solirubrobacteraceae bacterium TaxID=1162706 RepID=A0A6J4RMC4_9ACTN|nr:MAG: NAD-dependent epimerase/dehydratase [uncultured Solirubrobacteraceae bacterium]
MRLLILGGTVFLGRHVAAAALASGAEVTLFTRGRTGTDLFPEVERRTGDRAGDLAALADGEWDLVIDTSGFTPREVLASARLLEPRVARYVFVSTAGVHPGWPEEAGLDESAPVRECAADAGPQDGDYSTLKAGCERAVLEVFGPERSLSVRAGLIVGPHENVGRLPAWIERAERGGPLVAPAPPERPLQVLDARDLAHWMLTTAAAGARIAVGGTAAMADLVGALGATGRAVYAPDDALLVTGIAPWTELPFWLPDRQFPGAMRLDGRAAGLATRPLADTVADTRRWMLEEGGRDELRDARPARGGASVLEAARERALAQGLAQRGPG